MTRLQIRENVDLSRYTTFGFSQIAHQFVEVGTDEQLAEAISQANRRGLPVLALGGGSNLVLTRDFPGMVIRYTGRSVSYSASDENGKSLVRVGAGLEWHSLVLDSIEHGLAGLENLSLIPGSTGAAPVQNIGAYGVELSDRFVSLRALHIPSCEWVDFTREECNFSYRDSIFKHGNHEYFITELTLELGKDLEVQTAYAPLTDYLLRYHEHERPTPRLISQAVCAIRRSKLPDPAELPNAGSFFHNPLIDESQYVRLMQKFPDLVAYPAEQGGYKLAAGWLIDQLGLKGYRRNGVGVHDQQALVLIRYGDAQAADLLNLAEDIQRKVEDTYGVKLHIEPRLV